MCSIAPCERSAQKHATTVASREPQMYMSCLPFLMHDCVHVCDVYRHRLLLVLRN